ncbi:MAG: respiratory nitrate reductase subunit gamma [Desulfobacterales bacterium]
MKATIIPIVVLAILIGHPAAIAAQTVPGDGYTDSQCAECHEEPADDHAASVHKDVQCLECHAQAVEEDHEALAAVNCRQCHAPHDEKVIHDAHTRVACKACHQKDGIPVAEPETGLVIFSGNILAGRKLWPHQMVAERGDSFCQKCHFKGNALGASSMILPAKSILCMPCHAATFSIGDRTTLWSLLVFVVGICGVCVIFFSGGVGRGSGHMFRGGFSVLIVAMVTDVFFLRRLFRLSPGRWLIHALIFYPILIRLAFGMTALGLSLIVPDTDLARAMLDKNHPLQGMLFDSTGLMIFIGVAAALFRPQKDLQTIANLPKPGRTMTMLLGLIVLVGFILASLRIAMTGWPSGSQYAFIGYGLSLLLKSVPEITTIYGYVWYVHAILTGVFIALIPFTRMLHIFTAPVVLMADA